MKILCLMVPGILVLGLAGCADQRPAVVYDVPSEGPAAVNRQYSRQGYEEPASWIPAK